MSDIDLAVGNDDDMVNCPYDIGHRMLRKRLQQHLLKCRLNNPDVELIKCPFNQLHLVAEPDLEIHIRYCNDRKLITQYKHQASMLNEDVSHPPIECEGEDWDDDDSEDNKHQSFDQKAVKIERDRLDDVEEKKVVEQTHVPSVKQEPKKELFSQQTENDESNDCKPSVKPQMRSGERLMTDVRPAGNVASCSGRDSLDYRHNSGRERRKTRGYSNDDDDVGSSSSWKQSSFSYNAPYAKQDPRRRRN